MSRKPGQKANQPAYRFHVSGQARVTLDAKDYYLGEHNSQESWARYYELLAQYQRNGKIAPDVPQRQKELPITIAAVTALFRDRIDEIYADNPTEHGRYNNLCDLLDDEYGDMTAKKFRPRHLKEIRGIFVASGNNRRYTNEQTGRIKKVFEYAAGEGDLISPKVVKKLTKVENLRRGQRCAEASGKIPPESRRTPLVKLDIVKATAEHLSPTLCTMVALQVATGMRPSEICNMTPGEIDTSGEVPMYRPEKHKTAHHGTKKAVPIVGEAWIALQQFLDRGPDEYCFSPAESRQWYRDQQTAKRVTPEGQGDFVGSKDEKREEGGGPPPKRAPGDQWNKDSYRRAVQRAADKAGVTRWTPYSLRHNAATAVKALLDAEHAKDLLGHRHLSTTDIYARASEEKAIRAAQVMPQLGIVHPDDDDRAAS